jgi:hypothetical protein
MKRIIISEEEKSRILGMHQDAAKRHYLGEQEDFSSKVTYTDSKGVNYFVPGLTDNNMFKFAPVKQYDFISLFNTLNKMNIEPGTQLTTNPLTYGEDTIKQQQSNFMGKYNQTKNPTTSIEGLPILSGLESLNNAISYPMMAYLSLWRPGKKMNEILESPEFQNHKFVKWSKGYITNLNEVLTKLIPVRAQEAGLQGIV